MGTIWERNLPCGASTPWKRIRCNPGARHQRGQALQELQRRHDDVGGAVAVGAFELQHDLAGAVALEPLVGNGGAGDVTAQAFELLALMGAAAYGCMQKELGLSVSRVSRLIARAEWAKSKA